MQAAGDTKSPTPLGSMATQLYQLLCEQGFEDKDFSYIFKLIEKNKKDL
jgi:3-hydroxyisobutyrate dehydrogenase